MKTQLDPLEKTLAELVDAQKVRETKPKRIGDRHYDNLPLAIKRWQGKWYEDKPKSKS